MAPHRLRTSDLDVLRTIRTCVGRGRLRTSRKQTTVAGLTGVSERTVRSAYTRLESWGYFTRTRRPILKGGRKPDVIELRRPNRKRVAGSFISSQIGTPTGYQEAAIGSCGATLQSAQKGTSDQQPSLFGRSPSQPKPKAPRKESQSDRDYSRWLRIFEAILGRRRIAAGPASVGEERRHLKVLRQRLQDDERLIETFLREYVALDDQWLDDRDYPLRYALGNSYVKTLKIAQETITEEDAGNRPPEDPAAERAFWEQAEARAKAHTKQVHDSLEAQRQRWLAAMTPKQRAEWDRRQAETAARLKAEEERQQKYAEQSKAFMDRIRKRHERGYDA